MKKGEKKKKKSSDFRRKKVSYIARVACKLRGKIKNTNILKSYFVT
jgi:hypothetical protein